MKTKIWILMLILCFAFSLTAQNNDKPLEVSVEFRSFYNVLRISSFDVRNPQNQPTFFNMNVANKTEEPVDSPYLHFNFRYNDNNIIDQDTRARYRYSIPERGNIRLTNRDIFTEVDQPNFYRPEPSISLSDVIDEVPHIRDTVVKTGLFPDGVYVLTAQFRDETRRPLSNEIEVRFTVRNPGGIFLRSPGAPVGERIPSVSGTPLSFRWSSNLTGTDNRFNLKVKEFEEASELTPGFIETSGNTIVDESDLKDTYFSDFIDFKDNRYYAWQVSTGLLDSSDDPNNEIPSTDIKSQYYVFRYVTEGDGTQEREMNNLLMFLRSLNNPDIMNLIEAGYMPTGIIESRGRVYYAEEIQMALEELRKRNIIDIKITE